MKIQWKKDSWKSYKQLHQIVYPQKELFDSIISMLESYPPMVFRGEIENLKKQIADASRGARFILHGGDCAERFVDCNEESIMNKIKIILQMSVILTYGARKPVVKIGRIAGQYSKPRSNQYETVNGMKMLTYRGDAVNSFEPDISQREPDPKRLLSAYHHSVITLNYIRALISGGFADLHHPLTWNLRKMENTREWGRYRKTVDHILDAINFMESFGGIKSESLGVTDFFISHEGLLLGYEESLTRKDPDTGKYYNAGAHMLWIGERTRDIEGAHVEYFRGISNPVGIKIGPSINPDELVELINVLNPLNEEGRITVIPRLGHDKVNEILPRLLKAVKKSRMNAAFSSDPMHANIFTTADGKKTRNFTDIMAELRSSFMIHASEKIPLSGVHFELTGDDVTECVGGASVPDHNDLSINYETYCDPRLNYSQSLEIAFLISEFLTEK